MRKLSAVLLLLFLSSTASAADPATTVADANKAFFAGDAAALKTLAANTGAWASSTVRDEVYAAAFVRFRQTQLFVGAKDKAPLKAAGEACVSLTDAALRIDSRFAEAAALQSACYGYLASLGGFGAISSGRKSGKSMDVAIAGAANSPRVVLVDAISYGFRPRIAGGDKAKAYSRAKEAAALFDANPARSEGVLAWGHAEAWYWVGRGAQDAGDVGAARKAYERALTLAPNFSGAARRLAALK
jgi:tetratricopeptide (TPR) repeat protein